jgi:hypothetical protein
MEIIIDLPIGFLINNIISLKSKKLQKRSNLTEKSRCSSKQPLESQKEFWDKGIIEATIDFTGTNPMSNKSECMILFFVQIRLYAFIFCMGTPIWPS